MGELLAILATVLLAGSHIAVKRMLGTTSIPLGVLISLSGAWTVTALATVVNPPSTINAHASVLFCLSGLSAPGMARWAAMSGVTYLGPSTSIPITQAVRPVLAVAGGVLILRESPSGPELIGVLTIILGGWRLSRSISGNGRRRELRDATTWGVIFPVVAGINYATADLFAKAALEIQAEPIFGAFISTTSALIAWATMFTANPKLRRSVSFTASSMRMAVSGVMAGSGLVFLFLALEAAELTVVTPIASAQPLAVFVLSWLFLRDVERLNLPIVLAGIGVVVGTVLVAL